MDKIEELIKRLREAKEELNKREKDLGDGRSVIGDNASPEQVERKLEDIEMCKEDIEKDAKDPKLAPKDIKVKELQGKIDAGTYKPDASKIADKMLKGNEDQKDEYFKLFKNGQWSMEKGAFKELEHKLEGEGKSEESAGAIAYSVGEKKYGKAGMEHKAEAAKKSDDDGIC